MLDATGEWMPQWLDRIRIFGSQGAAFIPATSQNILVLAIFSGRHRDTLVDLAIVLFYQGHCKNPRLD